MAAPASPPESGILPASGTSVTGQSGGQDSMVETKVCFGVSAF